MRVPRARSVWPVGAETVVTEVWSDDVARYVKRNYTTPACVDCVIHSLRRRRANTRAYVRRAAAERRPADNHCF